MARFRLNRDWSITDLTISIPSSSSSTVRPTSSSLSTGRRPRWHSREFYAYYLVFLVVVPQMVLAVTRLGRLEQRRDDPLTWAIEPNLDDGWLFGWKIDTSDPQYRLFRSHLPLLVVLFAAFVSTTSLSRLVATRWYPATTTSTRGENERSRIKIRTRVLCLWGLALLVGLHGTSALKILAILSINYQIAKLAKRRDDPSRDGANGTLRDGVRDDKGASDHPTRPGSGRDDVEQRADETSLTRRPTRRTMIERRYVPFVTWGFNVAVLFANSVWKGYEFGSISHRLAWLDEHKGLLPRWQIMWNLSMLRLISFNMEYYWATAPPSPSSKTTTTTTTRPPSTTTTTIANGTAESNEMGPGQGAARNRLDETFSFERYLAYALYPPLYLAGPILSFVSFSDQLAPSSTTTSTSSAVATEVPTLANKCPRSPPPPPTLPSSASFTTDDPRDARVVPPGPASSSLTPYPPHSLPPPHPDRGVPNRSTALDVETSRRSIVSYTIRFLVSFLTMELVLHSMYVVAIKDSKPFEFVDGVGFGFAKGQGGGGGGGGGGGTGGEWWERLSCFEVCMVGFWNLIIVWLKLLIPWRFFRLVALLDGVAPPENMVRCMANNYSALGFWRSWHRSYNLWVIRYLYIPLGGSHRTPLISILAVFTFVALWHDLSLTLLVWGWTVTLFVLPEMIGTKLVSSQKYGHTTWYRHVAALGGVLNVLMMMTANLVGFVVGIDGAKGLWSKMLGGWEGRSFLLIASACLFVAIQVMFEYRAEEARRGINRRC
ncbi:hypothetical protein JCM10212_000244 [Sporobolomyces blumeae]